MKPSTLKLIEEKLILGFREAGLSLSGEARRLTSDLLANERFRRVAELPMDQVLASIMLATFLASCKKETEPTRAKLDQLLQMVPSIAYQLRPGVLEELKGLAKQLPRKRGGGPKPRLATPAEKGQACAQIAALVGQGVKLSEAIRRVARGARNGEGVSYRTMQRAWHGRPY